MTRSLETSRRALLLAGVACALVPAARAVAQAGPPPIQHPVARTTQPVRIGVIGSGRIGTLYGELWSKAGHPVMFSDRDAAAATAAAARSPGARVGTTAQAAAFGDVVLLSVPYGALPSISRELAAALRGKVVIDTSNPVPSRDGEAARQWVERGAGPSTAAFLPGAKVVRAYNILSFAAVAREANRPGAKVGIPIGGDDAQAVQLAGRLTREAGFEPVVVPGGLAATKRFDLGPPLQGQVLTAAEVRRALAL